MKIKVVEVRSIKTPIQPSPGFHKKALSQAKLDLCGRCGFGCSYCSSDDGNYLRIRRSAFADLTEQQLGERTLPRDDGALMFVWPDVLDRLREQLDQHRKTWGRGKTLVFSMLTDPFHPLLVAKGVTEDALRLVLDRTSFRVRVLTKSALVGTPRWIQLFSEHADRFVIGLSIGTPDAQWARRVEEGTSAPSARIGALHHLQEAGLATYGMLCPVFPDALGGRQLEDLIDRLRPELLEDIWAEPYNDRINWRRVRESLPEPSASRDWLTETFERRKTHLWSEYAAELYERLREHAERCGWLGKLRYLLYEDLVRREDAERFKDLSGVMLQSRPDADGWSRNKWIAEIQRASIKPKVEYRGAVNGDSADVGLSDRTVT